MFKVDKEKCIRCGACLNVCPVGAISIINNKAEIDGSKCRDCGKCAQACPQGAIHPGLGAGVQQTFSPNQGQEFSSSGFGMGGGQGRGMGGMGRGMSRGMGHGLRRGPCDGRGRCR